jgi:hypothetical protein
MAAAAAKTCHMAQLPRLDDDNFKFWSQSLMLVANGLGVYKFIQAPTDPDTLQEAQKKLFFLLTNKMLTSMSEKAW